MGKFRGISAFTLGKLFDACRSRKKFILSRLYRNVDKFRFIEKKVIFSNEKK